jgi:hypothetical protein
MIMIGSTSVRTLLCLLPTTTFLASSRVQMVEFVGQACVNARADSQETIVKMNVSSIFCSRVIALLNDTSIMWWIIIFALIGAAIVLVFMLLRAQRSQ